MRIWVLNHQVITIRGLAGLVAVLTLAAAVVLGTAPANADPPCDIDYAQANNK
jgi:hypothetical protein